MFLVVYCIVPSIHPFHSEDIVRFTTDVSVVESETPVLRVITRALVPEAMGSFPFEGTSICPDCPPLGYKGPHSALPAPQDEYPEDGPIGRVSPFVISDTDL